MHRDGMDNLRRRTRHEEEEEDAGDVEYRKAKQIALWITHPKPQQRFVVRRDEAHVSCTGKGSSIDKDGVDVDGEENVDGVVDGDTSRGMKQVLVTPLLKEEKRSCVACHLRVEIGQTSNDIDGPDTQKLLELDGWLRNDVIDAFGAQIKIRSKRNGVV